MQKVGYHVRETSQAEMILGTLRPELHLVESSFKEALLYTVLSHFLECIIESLFALLDVLQLDSLHAHREGGLLCGVIVAVSRAEARRNPLLYDPFVERRIWPIKEQTRKNLEAECLVRVRSWLVAQVGDPQLCLLVCICHKVWHEPSLLV